MSTLDKAHLPELLTPQEVNELLRMNWKNPYSCLARLCQKGVLKGVRVGNRFRYPRQEILRLMEGRLEETPGEEAGHE